MQEERGSVEPVLVLPAVLKLYEEMLSFNAKKLPLIE